MSTPKYPQIGADTWEGKLTLTFNCPGLCAYALCPMMPPDGTEPCVYREYGACRNISAQIEAIKALRRSLASALKDLNDKIDNE